MKPHAPPPPRPFLSAKQLLYTTTRYSCRQLHYTGVLAVAQTQHASYPMSMPHRNFASRWGCLTAVGSAKGATDEELCRVLLHKRWLDEASVMIGKTKVYMRVEVGSSEQ